MRKSLLAGFVFSALAMSASAQTLLAVNQDSSNLSVLDPATGAQLATVAENTPGVHAHEVAVSADGSTAWLPIYGSSGVGKPGIDGREILILDVPSRKITGAIQFTHGVRPHLPVLDPVHSLLYVTTELDQSVTIIDPRTNRILGSVPTGQPESHMFAISHDGRRGYTANVGPGTVSVLDLVQRKTLGVIPVSGKVQRISISNDDKYVFTSDEVKPRLAVIDAATSKVQQWIPLPGFGYGTAPTPDGNYLVVAVISTNQVAAVDLHTMRVIHTLTVPGPPQEVLIPHNSRVAYVSCGRSNQIAVIDLARWKVQKLIPAGRFVDGMAWVK